MASSPPATNGPLQNMYYKRPVGTPKPCSMCYRETRTVLWNPQDFLYICDTHLTDPGFATPVAPDASPKPTLSEDQITKVKDEWSQLQAAKKAEQEAKEKAEKEKEKEGEKKEGGGISAAAAGFLGWATGSSASTSSSAASTPTGSKKAQLPSLFSSPGGTPSHQKFILHRQIFAMRQTEFRKKRNTSQANAIAPRLPIVPGHLS